MTSPASIAEAIAQLELDEPEPVRPCCSRLPHGGWCTGIDGHPGDHAGPPTHFGQAPPPPERRSMTAWRDEVSRKWNDKPGPNGAPSPAELWIAAVEGRTLP